MDLEGINTNSIQPKTRIMKYFLIHFELRKRVLTMKLKKILEYYKAYKKYSKLVNELIKQKTNQS
jgi:uncharacterized CHY-type Zn-finger protein